MHVWDTIVGGGGLAGLSAATQIAQTGRRVLLIERKQILGGRASSFYDAVSGEVLDNGQHAFMGCYHEIRSFLRRIGSWEKVAFQSVFSSTMVGPDGKQDVLKAASIPAPFHLAWGLLTYRALSFKDRLATLRVAQAARKTKSLPNTLSVSAWLDGLGQSKISQDRFWTPLTLATINAYPQQAQAQMLAVVLREGFLSGAKNSALGLAQVGLSDLHGKPSADFVATHNGEVRTRLSVQGIDVDQEGMIHVSLSDGNKEKAKTFISSLPPVDLLKVAMRSTQSFREHVGPCARLTGSPILSVHAWGCGKIFSTPFVGIWEGPFHWIFQKQLIDENPTKKHISLVISSASEIWKHTKEELMQLAQEELRKLSRCRSLEITRVVVCRDACATWLPPLEEGMSRLSTHTSIPNVFLAGDWTDADLPATMESAVKSGHWAATAALERLDAFRCLKR